jgi:hypothetical protein
VHPAYTHRNIISYGQQEKRKKYSLSKELLKRTMFEVKLATKNLQN